MLRGGRDASAVLAVGLMLGLRAREFKADALHWWLMSAPSWAELSNSNHGQSPPSQSHASSSICRLSLFSIGFIEEAGKFWFFTLILFLILVMFNYFGEGACMVAVRHPCALPHAAALAHKLKPALWAASHPHGLKPTPQA